MTPTGFGSHFQLLSSCYDTRNRCPYPNGSFQQHLLGLKYSPSRRKALAVPFPLFHRSGKKRGAQSDGLLLKSFGRKDFLFLRCRYRRIALRTGPCMGLRSPYCRKTGTAWCSSSTASKALPWARAFSATRVSLSRLLTPFCVRYKICEPKSF